MYHDVVFGGIKLYKHVFTLFVKNFYLALYLGPLLAQRKKRILSLHSSQTEQLGFRQNNMSGSGKNT